MSTRLDGLAEGCVVFADAGYRGQGDDAAREGYVLEVVERPEADEGNPLKAKGFTPLPKRWVIEQLFGRLSQWRGIRLSHERRSRYVETAFLCANMLGLLAHIGS